MLAGSQADRGRSLATKIRVSSAEGLGTSPVKRVLDLLGKMKAELSAEADKESEMYDKMVCWCETNEKEKKQAVADAEAKDLELSSELETRSAGSGRLSAEIPNLKEQIAEDTEALEKATAIRESTAAEFRAKEKEIVQITTNLKNAIAALSKQNSLMQMEAPLVAGLRVMLRDVALKYELLRAETDERASPPLELLQTASGAPSKTRVGGETLQSALLQAMDVNGGGAVAESMPLGIAQQLVAQAARTAQPSGAAKGVRGSFAQMGAQQPVDAAYESYSPRSSAIFGIMNQMLEDFSKELSDAQVKEQTAIEEYQALAQAKKRAITAAKEKLDELEGDNADNAKALSDIKEELALTRKQRSEDVEFLRNLQGTCNDLDKEWERRSETRAEEIKAVSEAMAILTNDDNRELLAKSVSLLQEHSESTSSTSAAMRRARAAAALRHAAQAPDFDAEDLLAAWRGRNGHRVASIAAGPRGQLSALAVSMQLDDFAEVKAMMDTMVSELKQQQKEEAEFKAYCTKELNENEKMTYSKQQHKKDLEAKAEKLAALIDKLSKDISEAKSKVGATQVEIKKASQLREAENAAFQTTVTEQRNTQVILKQVLIRLQDFYQKGKGKKVIYLQHGKQTPPVQFTKYTTNAGSSPVMGLLEQIIGDSKALEGEATAAEYEAQATYEAFVKDSNRLIKSLEEEIAAKMRATAQAELDAAETASGIESAAGELDSLAAAEADLHSECDFVLKNFEVRQKARLQEMEAIQTAKGILSGAK